MADPQHEESPGDERDDDAAPVTATDDGAIDKTPPRDGPPTAVLALALGLAVATVVGVAVFAARRTPDTGPVPVAAVPAPQADSPSCRDVLAALPDTLGDYKSAEIVAPVPPGVAAWRNDASESSVILRCGLDRPADFRVGSALQVVNGVSWFQVSDSGLSSWYAVDRPVYLALTLPDGSGAEPITAISTAISKTLPPKKIDPTPAR